jgi:hypothetical protein
MSSQLSSKPRIFWAVEGSVSDNLGLLSAKQGIFRTSHQASDNAASAGGIHILKLRRPQAWLGKQWHFPKETKASLTINIQNRGVWERKETASLRITRALFISQISSPLFLFLSLQVKSNDIVRGHWASLPWWGQHLAHLDYLQSTAASYSSYLLKPWCMLQSFQVLTL